MAVEPLQKIEFSDEIKGNFKQIVETIRAETPGQIQSRYIARINVHRGDLLSEIKERFRTDKKPILLSNLPKFSDIEDTKILLLLLGESLGKCAAYSEYNQSYITDIRPTQLSAESSSGKELLSMHSDLAFALDACRPIAQVLVPHIADNTVPKTLLAPADAILASLPQETIEILEQNIFEIRSGGKLLWPCEQIRRISVVDRDVHGARRVRLNFENIKPIPHLDQDEAQRAREALTVISKEALRIGCIAGHQILKGEALLIPNDHCLHGRDVYGSEGGDRLLLRSYLVTEEMVQNLNGNTMISLRQ